MIDSIKDTWKNHKKTAGVGLVLAVACFGATGGASLGIWAACVGLKTAYDVGKGCYKNYKAAKEERANAELSTNVQLDLGQQKQQHIATEMPISPPTPPPPYQAADKEQPKQQHITTEAPIPPPAPTPPLNKGLQEKNKSSRRTIV